MHDPDLPRGSVDTFVPVPGLHEPAIASVAQQKCLCSPVGKAEGHQAAVEAATSWEGLGGTFGGPARPGGRWEPRARPDPGNQANGFPVYESPSDSGIAADRRMRVRAKTRDT